MTKYVATINVPGHLPTDEQPAVFDTPGEAWAHLRDERRRAEDDAHEGSNDEPYSDTFYTLKRYARWASNEPTWSGAIDTVHGGTPGNDSPHDLGRSYSVDVYGDEI